MSQPRDSHDASQAAPVWRVSSTNAPVAHRFRKEGAHAASGSSCCSTDDVNQRPFVEHNHYPCQIQSPHQDQLNLVNVFLEDLQPQAINTLAHADVSADYSHLRYDESTEKAQSQGLQPHSNNLNAYAAFLRGIRQQSVLESDQNGAQANVDQRHLTLASNSSHTDTSQPFSGLHPNLSTLFDQPGLCESFSVDNFGAQLCNTLDDFFPHGFKEDTQLSDGKQHALTEVGSTTSPSTQNVASDLFNGHAADDADKWCICKTCREVHHSLTEYKLHLQSGPCSRRRPSVVRRSQSIANIGPTTSGGERRMQNASAFYCEVVGCNRGKQGSRPFARKDNFRIHMRTVHADKPRKKPGNAKPKLETESNNEVDDQSASSADPATGTTTSDESFSELPSAANEVSSISPSSTDGAEQAQACNFDSRFDLTTLGGLDSDWLMQGDSDVSSFSMASLTSAAGLRGHETHKNSDSKFVPAPEVAIKRRVFDTVRNEYVVPPTPSVPLAVVREKRDGDEIGSLPEQGPHFDITMEDDFDFPDSVNYPLGLGHDEMYSSFNDLAFMPEMGYHS